MGMKKAAASNMAIVDDSVPIQSVEPCRNTSAGRPRIPLEDRKLAIIETETGNHPSCLLAVRKILLDCRRRSAQAKYTPIDMDSRRNPTSTT